MVKSSNELRQSLLQDDTHVQFNMIDDVAPSQMPHRSDTMVAQVTRVVSWA